MRAPRTAKLVQSGRGKLQPTRSSPAVLGMTPRAGSAAEKSAFVEMPRKSFPRNSVEKKQSPLLRPREGRFSRGRRLTMNPANKRGEVRPANAPLPSVLFVVLTSTIPPPLAAQASQNSQRSSPCAPLHPPTVLLPHYPPATCLSRKVRAWRHALAPIRGSATSIVPKCSYVHISRKYARRGIMSPKMHFAT
jgi:hypothetical protein